jgi:signal transduction histidine kinase
MKELGEKYAEGLLAYVATGSEEVLVEIERLGAEAMRRDVPLEELAGVQEEATLRLAAGRGSLLDERAIRRMSAAFSSLMLSSFLTYRSRFDLLEWQHRQERARTERARQRLESLGQMVGGVAHELNNLLQPMCGLGELLLLDLDDTRPERASVEVIAGCAGKAAGIVRNILSYVRQSATRRTPTALGDAVTAAVDFLRPVLLLQQNLVVRIDDHASAVSASEGELTQILLNLLQNAAQAASTRIELSVGRIEPRASSSGGEARPPTLTIVVADDGCGMPPDVAVRATEPFFTTKPAGQGTGLGLAVVAGIVHDWGGDLSIDTRPGSGTRIVIRLPIVDETADLVRPPHRPASPSV